MSASTCASTCASADTGDASPDLAGMVGAHLASLAQEWHLNQFPPERNPGFQIASALGVAGERTPHLVEHELAGRYDVQRQREPSRRSAG